MKPSNEPSFAEKLQAKNVMLRGEVYRLRHSYDVVSVALDRLCRDAGRGRADYIAEAKQTLRDYPNYFAQADETPDGRERTE